MVVYREKDLLSKLLVEFKLRFDLLQNDGVLNPGIGIDPENRIQSSGKHEYTRITTVNAHVSCHLL